MEFGIWHLAFDIEFWHLTIDEVISAIWVFMNQSVAIMFLRDASASKNSRHLTLKSPWTPPHLLSALTDTLILQGGARHCTDHVDVYLRRTCSYFSPFLLQRTWWQSSVDSQGAPSQGPRLGSAWIVEWDKHQVMRRDCCDTRDSNGGFSRTLRGCSHIISAEFGGFWTLPPAADIMWI